jgi:DNA-binding protein H-NS
MRFNLKKMTFDDLIALRDNVAGLISKQAQSAKRELEAKLAALDGLTGFTGSGKRRGRPPGSGKGKTGRKVAPKYRNPKDRSETWSGRGRMPLWLQGMIKEGRKREEFAITRGAAARSKPTAKRGRRKARKVKA